MHEYEKEKIAALPSQIFMTTLCHPIEYAKVLIQIGFEPLPPQHSSTLFGRPAMILPNVFKYIRHIKTEDGFFGCYNGLSARILGLVASTQLSGKIIRFARLDWPEISDPPNIVTDDEPQVEDYLKLGRRDLVLHTASVLVSYPFQLVSIRMMASFVGKEIEYSSLVNSVISIYKENGLSGFYHGILPKLLGDLTSTVLTGVLAYLVNKYLIKTKELRYYTVPVLTYFASTVTYPMIVVSTCMAVTGCSLKAGNPPMMPEYQVWHDCWTDLVRRRQHKRGSSLIFRYYVPPPNAL